MTSEHDWTAAVREAVDTYGKLDILVNNAGVLSFNKSALNGHGAESVARGLVSGRLLSVDHPQLLPGVVSDEYTATSGYRNVGQE